MNSNKPITNIINQLKRIKCLECGYYLRFNKLLSYRSSLNFSCRCNLFNYLLYIYFKDNFNSSDFFNIRHINSNRCLISISKTYQICLYEDPPNAFTKEVMSINSDEYSIASEESLFNILNNNLQIYSKLQKNLIFI